MTSAELDELERYINHSAENLCFDVHLTKRTALKLLSLARIGAAMKKIRPDEWEYIIKTFERGNDRQWAIACELSRIAEGIKDEQRMENQS